MAVSDLELRREDADGAGWERWRHPRELRLGGLGLLPGPRFSHPASRGESSAVTPECALVLASVCLHLGLSG